MLDRITPILLTRDEEDNIGRTLAQLTWASEVIIVDSLSTDATVRIARTFPNVRVLERAFDNLAAQWDFGIAHATSEWVLTLDADYFIPAALRDELAALQPPDDVAAYEASFRYAVNGKPLRATLYTPRLVLLRRGRVEHYMDGHAQRVRVDGRIAALRERIIHDDRKSFARFVARQRKYMQQESEKLRTADPRTLNTVARVRKLRVIAPLVILPYVLLRKGLILDGRAGLRYAFERFVAECMLSRALFRPARSSSRPSPADPSSS